MDDFEQEYKLETIEEIQDNLYKIADIVNNLYEGAHIDEVYNELFRLTHNIKGGVQSANFTHFSKVVNDLETHLIFLRDGKVQYSEKFFSVLDSCCTVFQNAIDRLKHDLNADIDFSNLEKKIHNLTQVEETNSSEPDNPSSDKKDDSITVLVIDDEESNAKHIATLLKSQFHINIETTLNRDKAFELCEQNKYEAIIVDNYLCEQTGERPHHCVQFLRMGKTPNKETPVLLIVGSKVNLKCNYHIWDDVYFIEQPFDDKYIIFNFKCALNSRKIFSKLHL